MEFTNVDNSGRVDGFCIVKSVEKKTSSKGDTYLDFTLGDKSGEINAKLWRYTPLEHGEYGAGDLVKVRGTVSPYNGVDQLRIERIRPAIDSDNVKAEDFVRSAAFDGEKMYNELLSVAGGFEDTDLKNLVTEIYKDNREALLYWPAAYKLHHAMRGGLLMHTLSIVRLCQAVSNIYPFVDGDLLIAGAMLHDIAKIKEFEVNASGTAEGYSVKGNLLGHLAMGAAVIKEYAEKLGVKEETSVLLQHMVLSHHGNPEFGAAVRPMTVEAEILSELDLMDARLYEIKDALLPVKGGEFSGKLWALDNIKMYNHARKDLNNEPKLF